jgi:hypothetical protein
MSLVSDLLAASKALPPSHIPGASELASFAGALAAYAEHGQAFIEAARPVIEQTEPDLLRASENVAKLFGGADAEAAVESDATKVHDDYEDLLAEVQRLRASHDVPPPASPSTPGGATFPIGS